MTLVDTLQEIAPDGVEGSTIYIGAKTTSGFFFCGTVKQFMAAEQALSRDRKFLLEEAIERQKNKIENVAEAVNRFHEYNNKESCEHFLGNVVKEIRASANWLWKAKRSLAKWERYSKRQVLEQYSKTCPGEEGIAIIISGPDFGPTKWLRQEFEGGK